MEKEPTSSTSIPDQLTALHGKVMVAQIGNTSRLDLQNSMASSWAELSSPSLSSRARKCGVGGQRPHCRIVVVDRTAACAAPSSLVG